MDEKPRRRRFQFSLRTLLLAVTVLCVWLGWQYRIVYERREVGKLVVEKGGSFGKLWPGESKLSWIRHAFGDEQVPYIMFQDLRQLSSDDEALIRTAFPEASVIANPLTTDTSLHF